MRITSHVGIQNAKQEEETKTQTRINKRMVTFQHPFRLNDVDSELPAGDYVVETEEELVEEISFVGFRWVSMTLVSHSSKIGPGVTRFWPVRPEDLEEALMRDAETTQEAPGPPIGEYYQANKMKGESTND